jgi:hypothetical protein
LIDNPWPILYRELDKVTEGEGWGALCPFMGVEVPDVPFPHEDPKDPSWSGKVRAAAELEATETSGEGRRASALLPEHRERVGTGGTLAQLAHDRGGWGGELVRLR